MADDMVNELRGTKKKGVFSSGKLLLILAVLLFLIAVPSGFYLFYNIDNTIPLSAQITNFRGSVLVQKSGETATIPAEKDMVLRENDNIISDSDGLVEIVFEDGSHTRLGADTRLKISKLHTYENSDSRIIELDLSLGKLWANVTDIVDDSSSFDIYTPTSITEVQGTQFFARAMESKESLVRVYEGVVNVSSGLGLDAGNSDDDSGPQITVSDLQQVGFSPELQAPIEASPIDFKDVEEFEKDNLVEDSPIIYLDVDYTIMTVLISEKESDISSFNVSIEEIEKDKDAVNSLLIEETDEDVKDDLEEIIDIYNSIVADKEEIIGLLEKEVAEYENIKEIIDIIKTAIEENFQDMSQEEMIDKIRREARNVRLSYKAGEEERLASKQEIGNKEIAISEGLEKISKLAMSRGISGELIFVDDVDYPYDEEEKPEEDTDVEVDVEDEAEDEVPVDEVEDEDEPKEDRDEPVVEERVTRDPAPAPTPPTQQPVVSRYNVSLSANLVTAGNISGGGSFTDGSKVTIKAEPKKGFRFVRWLSGGNEVSTDKSYTFTVSGNRSFKAIFTPNVHLVTFTDHNNNPIAHDVVNYGESAKEPHFIPFREGYVFVGWNKSLANITKNITVKPLYEEKTHEVRFLDYNDEVLKTAKVPFGGKATPPDDPSREGYKFTGWDQDFSFVATDLTVRANYTAIKTTYMVTFKDYDGTVIDSYEVEHGGAAQAPDDPTREGYTFTGWDKDFTNVTKDLTVTAIFEIKKYIVTFENYDGTVLDNYEVEHGGAAQAPDDPIREGYTFTGWDKDFTNVTDNLTVRAQYEEVDEPSIDEYTVTFEDHDGNILATETVNHGNSATAPADPERAGYAFTGWDTSFSNVTGDLTVRATYIETPVAGRYIVTFLDWDGTLLNAEEVEEGSGATAPATPERTGYTFTGWDTSFSYITGDLTVTAEYDISVYTLTYIAESNGYIVGGANQSVKHGSDGKDVAAIPDEGYDFVSWSDGNGSKFRRDTNVNADLTVTAIFEIKKYIVTFKDDDDNVLSAYEVEHGGAAQAPEVPARDGYTFTGWDKDFTNVTDNLTVTAVYEEELSEEGDGEGGNECNNEELISSVDSKEESKKDCESESADLDGADLEKEQKESLQNNETADLLLESSGEGGENSSLSVIEEIDKSCNNEKESEVIKNDIIDSDTEKSAEVYCSSDDCTENV